MATATVTSSSSRPVSDEHVPATVTTPPPCPFCGGERTEIMSLFGSHASLTTCWCADCRGPFEFLRWRDRPAIGSPVSEERNMDPARGVE